MSWNENLKDIREQHKHTQQELAEILGWSRPTIARYEAGTKEPTIGFLIAFCQIYKIDPKTIIREELKQKFKRKEKK